MGTSPLRGGGYHLHQDPDGTGAREPYLPERQSWILERLRWGERINPRVIMDGFGVSRATAERDLAALRKAGMIEFVGAPKVGRYRLKRVEA